MASFAVSTIIQVCVTHCGRGAVALQVQLRGQGFAKKNTFGGVVDERIGQA